MDVSPPFQLTFADIEAGDLNPSDVGMWCVRDNDCYHLFETETQAKRAHALMKNGELVR